MGKHICVECSGSEWEAIVNNIVHDEPETTLFQCKKCKRVVVYHDWSMEYTEEDVRL
jgi:DNA-directed RNA polymerase subunit M/transcription elongation factor TFIIS